VDMILYCKRGLMINTHHRPVLRALNPVGDIRFMHHSDRIFSMDILFLFNLYVSVPQSHSRNRGKCNDDLKTDLLTAFLPFCRHRQYLRYHHTLAPFVYTTDCMPRVAFPACVECACTSCLPANQTRCNNIQIKVSCHLVVCQVIFTNQPQLPYSNQQNRCLHCFLAKTKRTT
jgi:hypothetical protein